MDTIIIKNNSFCIIKNSLKNPYKNYQIFQAKFIISQNIISKTNFNEIKLLSYFAPWIKFHKCGYDNKIINDYYKYKKNMYDIKLNKPSNHIR